MGQDGTWVDSVFVQLTAWYMGLDIKILTTSSKHENPYIIVTGEINISTASSEGPPFLLGNYTNVHYQSLLPLSLGYEAKKKSTEQNTDKDTISAEDDFIYLHRGEQLTFPVLNSKLQCPFCNMSFSRITNHISSQQCFISGANIDLTQFTVQLDSYREGFRLEMGRKRKQKSQAKLINERGKDTVRKEHNERQGKSQAKLKAERGNDTVKKEQNERKVKSQAKVNEERGTDTVKKEHKERQAKSQAKIIEERGKDAAKKDQTERKVKSRDKLRVEKGPEINQKEQNAWENQSRKRKLEVNPEALHINEQSRKKLSRKKQRREAPEKLKEYQIKWQQKHRLVDSEKKRLKKFRRKTMFNAIFTCICCHRDLFESNVIKFTNNLLIQIESKKPGLYMRSIEMIGNPEEESPSMVTINGVTSSYICHA
jgi:hypothetical protein